jgi:hypothetical protein
LFLNRHGRQTAGSIHKSFEIFPTGSLELQKANNGIEAAFLKRSMTLKSNHTNAEVFGLLQQ